MVRNKKSPPVRLTRPKPVLAGTQQLFLGRGPDASLPRAQRSPAHPRAGFSPRASKRRASLLFFSRDRIFPFFRVAKSHAVKVARFHSLWKGRQIATFSYSFKSSLFLPSRRRRVRKGRRTFSKRLPRSLEKDTTKFIFEFGEKNLFSSRENHKILPPPSPLPLPVLSESRCRNFVIGFEVF